MSGELRIPGQPNAGTNNPLLILSETITEHVAGPLKRIADAMGDALERDHRYAVAPIELPQHGKVWGTYCTGCSAQANQYVYPCSENPEEPIKPPPAFTIGKAFVPREDGAFQVFEDGLPTS